MKAIPTMRRAAALAALVCAAHVAHAAGAADDTVRVTRMRYVMGTLASITAFAPDSAVADTAIDAGFVEMERLDTLLTDWRNTGDVARINAAAGAGGYVTVSPEAFEVITRALAWSVRSRGAFDPTIRPLVAAWGFRDSSGTWRAPTKAQIARAKALVDARRLQADSVRSAVRLTRDGMALDLGGIGKGYALDRAGACIEQHGVHRALLDMGGQLLALDAPPGTPGWPVVIADPRQPDRTLAQLALVRASVSTSSQAERSVGTGTKRVGHILDPRTGTAATASLSVSAIAPRAVDADALSTASFVLGPGEGLRLAKTCTGAEVLLLDPKGRTHRTSGFDKHTWR
jgi:thiamine biosynthesis lipoprotein